MDLRSRLGLTPAVALCRMPTWDAVVRFAQARGVDLEVQLIDARMVDELLAMYVQHVWICDGGLWVASETTCAVVDRARLLQPLLPSAVAKLPSGA